MTALVIRMVGVTVFSLWSLYGDGAATTAVQLFSEMLVAGVIFLTTRAPYRKFGAVRDTTLRHDMMTENCGENTR